MARPRTRPSPTPSAGGATEGIGILAAAIILLLTFGSLAAAGAPLLTAIVGVGMSMLSITALGHALGPSETTGTLATMPGLAVGIDYAVFIISRYRKERGRGNEVREAAGLAVGTAGSAVLFDAFIVRMTLVPGVLALVGERAWHPPRRADRILPRVDIGGEALTRRTARLKAQAADEEPNEEADRREPSSV